MTKYVPAINRGYLGTVYGSRTGQFKPPDTAHGAQYVCPHSREAGGGRLYSFIRAKKKPAHGGLVRRLKLLDQLGRHVQCERKPPAARPRLDILHFTRMDFKNTAL